MRSIYSALKFHVVGYGKALRIVMTMVLQDFILRVNINLQYEIFRIKCSYSDFHLY